MRPILILLAVTLAQRALADCILERRAYCALPRP
jgi:hypothetical protein